MTSTQVVETPVTTNKQSFSGLHQPGRSTKHKPDSPWSQPTTVLPRTTQTRTIICNQPQTLTHLGHNQQQSSGLHQPGRSTKHKPDSPWSQPTTVLPRTTQTRTIICNQPQTLTHLGHNQQQSSGLHQPGRSTKHKPDSPWSQPTTVVPRTTQTRTIICNQPQTLTHLGHNQQQSSGLHQPGRSTKHKPDSPWSQPTTVLPRTTQTRTIICNQPQTLTHLGHNQQQSSGLHHPGRSTKHKPDSPWSQPTTVLPRTTQTRTIICNQP